MGEGDSRAHRRDQEGQGEPLTEVRLEPTSGAFDVDAIAARILRIPHAARDPNAPSSFVLSSWRDGLRGALAKRSTSDILLDVAANRIHAASWTTRDHWFQELVRWLLTRHELRCFDEDYGGDFDIAGLFRPETENWPLTGTTLANDRFALLEWISGSPERGLYRGIDRTTGASVLVTTAPDTVRDAPELPFAGITPLLHVGPITQPSPGIPLVGLVEAEPAGAPSSELAIAEDDAAFRWALAVARIAEAAHARGETLGGIRPELVYVTAADAVSLARGETIEHVAIAPRCEPFLRRAGLPPEGAALPFEHLYSSRELVRDAYTHATPADDVFAIATTLAFWLNNLHPFAGSYGQNLFAIALGQRVSHVIVPAFVEQAMAPAATRSTLPQLISALASTASR